MSISSIISGLSFPTDPGAGVAVATGVGDSVATGAGSFVAGRGQTGWGHKYYSFDHHGGSCAE